jgi:hypothetical protein
MNIFKNSVYFELTHRTYSSLSSPQYYPPIYAYVFRLDVC